MARKGDGLIPMMVLLCALLVGACGESAAERDARRLTGGDPGRGELLVRRYGCNSCHLIPGFSEPKTQAGPPLAGILSRPQLAGRLPNTPENLIRWIRDPQSVSRGTQMPTLGVSEAEGRDLAAFLYALR
jgi:cytochrome c